MKSSISVDFIEKVYREEIELKYLNKRIRKDRDANYEKGDVVLVKCEESNKCKILGGKLYFDTINNADQTLNLSLKLNKFYNKSYHYKRYIVDRDTIKKIEKDTNEILSNLSKNYKIIQLKAKVADKIVIGIGGQSVFENDITLHYTYGVPYIPGQAIKGALRNYIYNEYIKGKSKDESVLENSILLDILGGNDEQGKVIFFDAFPITEVAVDCEVITAHHNNYYNDENSPPRDDDKVNPVKFLVAKESSSAGLKFNIYIAVDKYIGTKSNIIETRLKNTLMFNGVGGKTSVGYGFFDNIEIIKSK